MVEAKEQKKTVVETIKDNLVDIVNQKGQISRVKEDLMKNGISGGRIESVLNDPEVLNEADQREVALIVSELHQKIGIESLDPRQWYTDVELKRARQFDRRMLFEAEKMSDVTLENVSIVGNGVYVGTISVEMIAELYQNQILNYNFDIQRQAKIKKREDSIIMKPTVYRKNVNEIKELLLKGELVSTTVAFNAATGSSDSGDELVYDATTHSLTITEGTQLDILDGFHRCLASVEAYKQNPELNFNFMLMISNYTTREAQQYQAQLAKATPIPKSRVQELEANRRADTVVRQLRAESELQGKVSSHHQVSTAQGELVSYSTLSDAIDREFDLQTGRDVRDVSKFLIEFFDELLINYEQDFMSEREDNMSLMAYNKMFSGYVALAAKFKKEEVRVSHLTDVLDKIDFKRSNPLWKELGIVTQDGSIDRRSIEKKIVTYFKKLDIK